MARAVADIQKDIRQLSPNDQEELLFRLMEEFDLVLPELESLVAELAVVSEKTLKSLQALVRSHDGLDARLEQVRKAAREEVLRSGETWPFPMPPADVN